MHSVESRSLSWVARQVTFATNYLFLSDTMLTCVCVCDQSPPSRCSKTRPRLCRNLRQGLGWPALGWISSWLQWQNHQGGDPLDRLCCQRFAPHMMRPRDRHLLLDRFLQAGVETLGARRRPAEAKRIWQTSLGDASYKCVMPLPHLLSFTVSVWRYLN